MSKIKPGVKPEAVSAKLRSYKMARHLLEGMGNVPFGIMDLACKLYESKSVTLVEDDFDLGEEDALVYHLKVEIAPVEKRYLAKFDCPLLGDAMPRANGVILGSEHRSLRCSRRPCKHSVCPVALAACFEACHRLDEDADIPLYTRFCAKSRKGRDAVRSFREKWDDHLVDSDTALNLLFSEYENDFNGALVLEDESYRKDFVDDLARVLSLMGKIEYGARTETHLMQYIPKVDAVSMQFKPGGDNLPSKQLFVFDRLGEFMEGVFFDDRRHPFNETSKEFLIEKLGEIHDHRFVLIVGTEAEVTSFCDLNPKFLHTFDQNRLTLKALDMDEAFEIYLSYLDADVRAQIDDPQDLARRFKEFVGFNRDSLPFKGREMADYLAKHANSLRRPELPRSRYQSNSLEEMLEQVVGLQQVKDTVRQLEKFAMYKKQAEADGLQLPAASMHMVFTGNPGTGKTMMASIIATMLYKIGVIPQNKFHEVTARNLIGKYIGHTDKQTHAEIEKAFGGILFVDEAYALTSGRAGKKWGYGEESIAEFVKSMDAYKDRLIVIFAGYEKEMADFVETNPGLASRIGYTFRFADYSADELFEIFERAARRAGFTCGKGLDVELREVFAYHRRFKNFGNGRFAMELLHRMIVKHANAVSSGEVDEGNRYVLRVEDVPTRQERNDITDWEQVGAAEMLKPLVGMKDLKKKVCELEQVVSFYEEGRKAGLKLPDINLHMVFTGNPGTGKTTIARIIGKTLYNVGAIPTDKFCEVEAMDLARWDYFEGETVVDRYIRDAMGGVLFVDEAYAITYQPHGREIVAALVKAMEDHKGDFVVMFAGYRDEMREFIAINPGLASRVGYTFDFDDYDTDELQQIFELKMGNAGFALGEDVSEVTRSVFKYFHRVKDFGNGRFVDKVVQEVIAKHATNVAEATDETEDSLVRITVPDIPKIEDLCKLVSMPVYEPSDVSEEESTRRIAIHEMGHAVCSLALEGDTDISLVTIEQEGNGLLGYVEYKAGGQPLPTAQHFQNKLCSLMAGIAAEELLLGSFSAGGRDDLRQATNLASRYVGCYGMSNVGFLQYVGTHTVQAGTTIDVAKLPESVQVAMNDLLEREFDRAKETLQAYRGVYDAMVRELIDEGTISGEKIKTMWDELTGAEGADDHE